MDWENTHNLVHEYVLIHGYTTSPHLGFVESCEPLTDRYKVHFVKRNSYKICYSEELERISEEEAEVYRIMDL